eukprot:gene7634-biopygen12071
MVTSGRTAVNRWAARACFPEPYCPPRRCGRLKKTLSPPWPSYFLKSSPAHTDPRAARAGLPLSPAWCSAPLHHSSEWPPPFRKTGRRPQSKGRVAPSRPTFSGRSSGLALFALTMP